MFKNRLSASKPSISSFKSPKPKNPDPSLEKKHSIKEDATFHSSDKLELSHTFTRQRSFSELFGEKILTFHPEINENSKRLHSGRNRENVHKRLYKESKVFKRCKSYKSPEVKTTGSKIIVNDKLYKESVVHSAQRSVDFLVLKRTQLNLEAESLKPFPTICKTSAQSKRSFPIESHLLLGEIHKRSSRFRLIRKSKNP